jgi:uncharacterized membrane protein YcaP (DUF421 family)
MEPVFRAAAMYTVVWMVFRLTGRRTFAEMTAFDFVLLLICGEATQQALLGNDFSITNGALVVLTLVAIDLVLSMVKQRMPAVERVIDGLPIILIENGRMLRDRMNRERVDEGDIMEAARELRGLERLDQIKYAVLEKNGGITIVPR